jgi:hypothetical protein
MSLQKMRLVVQRAKLAKADREWFPRWLEQYAQFRRALQDDVIPVFRRVARPIWPGRAAAR